ncbi:MAG: hypothetical protein HGA37_03475 [Lentimicrobium sp.]|nr:hypothetical protein [Lentimicrobium sp.]
MKKIFLLGSFILSTITILAQPGTVSLNLDAGYTFQSTVDFDAAYTEVQGAFRYGGGIEYFADFNKSVVLKYHRMDTDFPLYLQNGEQLNSDRDSKGSVNYILIGGNNYFGDDLDAKALPYGGLGLGVGIVGVNENTATKFAWDARLGVKIKTSSVVSLKVEAYMQSIISTFGSDVWIGYNGYAYAVPDYATLWQFGFTGIVCFDFKK